MKKPDSGLQSEIGLIRFGMAGTLQLQPKQVTLSSRAKFPIASDPRQGKIAQIPLFSPWPKQIPSISVVQARASITNTQIARPLS